MLSHDWCVVLTTASREYQEGHQRANPDAFLFISRKVLPKLREMGVSQETIHQIMVDNPRRFFEGG